MQPEGQLCRDKPFFVEIGHFISFSAIVDEQRFAFCCYEQDKETFKHQSLLSQSHGQIPYHVCRSLTARSSLLVLRANLLWSWRMGVFKFSAPSREEKSTWLTSITA